MRTVLVRVQPPQPTLFLAKKTIDHERGYMGVVVLPSNLGWIRSFHSTIIRSAHSTIETKMGGLPNFAPHRFKSASVTSRAREHAPQEYIGICLATTFASVSLSGGQPTGKI